MAVRETPRISEILARFRAAQEKTAAGEGGMPPQGMPPQGMPPQGYDDMQGMLPQGMPPQGYDDMQGMPPQGYDGMPQQDYDDMQGGPGGGNGQQQQGGAPTRSQDGVTTAADVAQAAQAVEDTESELVNAKETMQEIAEAFMNEHTAALAKEAALFGEIFASSCMDAMERREMTGMLEKTAYDTVMSNLNRNALAGALSSCYSEAYLEGIAKIAGYEDADDLADAADMNGATAEELAEAISDYVDAGGDIEDLAEDVADDLSDEEAALLAEHLCANGACDCGDDDIDVADIEKEAYERTMYALG